MKVLKAFANNKMRSNVNIKFWSNNVIHTGDIVSIIYDEKERYFKIESVETEGDTRLAAYAANYGYYNLLKNIDLREILELPITLIEDQDTIKRLSNESRYC